MNEHTATPTSESVEEAMSKAIEPALHDPPADRPVSLAERIAGLGTPPDRAIPMPPPDRRIEAERLMAMPPPDRRIEPERPVSMSPPDRRMEPERPIAMPPPDRRIEPERPIAMPPPDRLIQAERPVVAASPVMEPFPAAPVVRPSHAAPVTPVAMATPATPMAAPAMPVAPAPTPRVPNRVYEHLVEGDDDVIGLIAYSLYKHDKRLWLMTWRAQHGAEATADQVEAFVNGQMTSGQRERYRTAARQVLDSYALVAVDMEKPQITREAVSGRVEAAARKVEASHRWWRQIPGVLIGAILSVGILIGVIAILVALDFDVGTYLGIAAEPAGETNVVP